MKKLFPIISVVLIACYSMVLFLKKTSRDCSQLCAQNIMSTHKAVPQCMKTKMNANAKVISYSLWGSLRKIYSDGIQENLDLMRSLYPDYVMRLYVSRSKLDIDAINTICDIQCNVTISTVSVKNHTFGGDFVIFNLLF